MPSSSDVRAGKAFVEVYVNNSALMKGLREAQNLLRDFGNGISTLGRGMMGIGMAIAAPMLAATKHFAGIGDQLDKMSGRTGISTNTLSELGFAAEQSGQNIEVVEQSIRKMQRSIGDAATGSKEQIDAFKRLGVSLESIQKLSPDAQFEAIMDALGKITDPTMRAATAMEIFGRSGTALLPMIGQMRQLRAEARELGLSIGRDQAKSAAELTDAWNRMKRAAGAASVNLGSALMPTIHAAVESVKTLAVEVNAWVRANGDVVRTIFRLATETAVLGASIFAIGKGFLAASSAIGAMRAAITFVASGGVMLTASLGALALGIGAVAAAFVNAKVQGISFGESVLDLTNRLTGTSNAYARLRDHLGRETEHNNATRQIEEAQNAGNTTGSARGIDRLQRDREAAQKQYEASHKQLAPWFSKKKLASLEAGEIDNWVEPWSKDLIQQAIEARQEVQRLTSMIDVLHQKQKTALVAKVVSSPISAMLAGVNFVQNGMMAGRQFVDGFVESVTSRLKAVSEAMWDLKQIRAEEIQNPQARDEAKTNIEYDRKAAALRQKIADGKAGPEAIIVNEAQRQAEIDNIRKKYAEEAAERERQLADETAAARVEATKRGLDRELSLLKIRQQAEIDEAKKKGYSLAPLEEKHAAERSAIISKNQRDTQDEMDRLQIEATKTGIEKELALLRMKQQKEMEDATAAGIDTSQLAAKQDLERRAFMLQNVAQKTSVGFSLSALQGEVGAGVQEKIHGVLQKIFTFSGQQTSILQAIQTAQSKTVLAMAK